MKITHLFAALMVIRLSLLSQLCLPQTGTAGNNRISQMRQLLIDSVGLTAVQADSVTAMRREILPRMNAINADASLTGDEKKSKIKELNTQLITGYSSYMTKDLIRKLQDFLQRQRSRQTGNGLQTTGLNGSPTPAGGPGESEDVPAGAAGSVSNRIASRNFPSIFAPWNIGPDRPMLSDPGKKAARMTGIARHDLCWNVWNSLGLRAAGDQPYIILSPQFTPESIQAAWRARSELLAQNPHLVILAAVNYFAANVGSNWLPPESPYWIGEIKNNEWHNRRLDFTNPEFQNKVAALCGELVKTGVFDGIMLDLWNDQWDNKQNYAKESAARLPLIRKIRAAIGDNAILVGNVNGTIPSGTASYLNGIYMEGFGAYYFPDWRIAASNLLWAQSHLRQPVITALEGWYGCQTPDCQGDPATIQQQGRADLARMRCITTLSLVFSNGYALFSDPNSLRTPDHLHDWYSFWSKSLGKAVGPLATLDRPDLSGAYTRQFEKGEAVFNPPSNHPVTISFPEVRRSAAANATGRSFTVAAGDGDLFLPVDEVISPSPPQDSIAHIY